MPTKCNSNAAVSPSGQYRYPGPDSFRDDETDSRLFFGRDLEVEEVLNRLVANKLLVLYAKSGLGKTSLLQAGLFPKLRDLAYVPIRLRFNHYNTSLIDELRHAVERCCQEQAIVFSHGVGDSYWEYFNSALFSKGEQFYTPVLALDQFEEIFTLQNADYRNTLGKQLGHLVTGQMPDSVYQRLQATDSKQTPTTLPAIHLLLSLREDSVGALHELAQYLPGILAQRFRLTELDRERAALAIIEPAKLLGDNFAALPFCYQSQPDTVAAMLDYLANVDSNTPIPLLAQTIEPFQLQLLCRFIEQKVIHQQSLSPEPVEVDIASYFGGKDGMAQVIKRFYQEALNTVGAWPTRRKAKRLCETGLLNAEGRRESLSRSQIHREFKLKQTTLNQLVEQKVLRREERLGSHAYELTHDSLAKAVFEVRRSRVKRNLAAMTGIIVLSAGLVAGQYQLNQRIKAQNQTLQASTNSSLAAYQALVEADVDAGKIKQPVMVRIKQGTFMMGSNEYDNEKPIHQVSIKAFNMGVYEVTFEEYDQFAATELGKLPDDNGWGRGKQPVINVTWDDATAYAQWLSQKTHKHYRLPTEAEWEYATRAGSTSAFTWGDNISTDLANYNGNVSYNGSPKGDYRQKTLPVDSFKANAFGLYNVHGNVWEWVQDCYQENYQQAPPDGTTFESANCAARVVRGGSWINEPFNLRSADRFWSNPYQRGDFLGFRLAQD